MTEVLVGLFAVVVVLGVVVCYLFNEVKFLRGRVDSLNEDVNGRYGAVNGRIMERINEWWNGYVGQFSKGCGARQGVEEMIESALPLKRLILLEQHLGVEYTPMWAIGPEYRKVKKGVKKNG